MVERIDRLRNQSRHRRLVPRKIDGKYLIESNRRLLNFGSNDYLGIAMQSGLAQAGMATSDQTAASDQTADNIEARGSATNRSWTSNDLGSGSTASPLVCGYSPLHQQLCDRITALEGTEDTLLYPSGFAACSSVLPSLAEAGDVILSDALNHASLIDGCRLSKAERFVYPHRDHQAVKALLSNHRHRFQRAFLVTDSIFSMDGTRAPLRQLADLADRFDAILIVDEAHATGVFGSDGGGMCQELSLEHRIPIRIGTLSKAIGAQGGFVTGPAIVIDFLTQSARSMIYSTAAAPTVIAAALHGLEIIAAEPQRRARVHQLADLLVEMLTANGFRTPCERTPIVPIILGDDSAATRAARQLHEDGFFVPAIRPPTVPAGSARLRISLSAAHDEDDLRRLVESIRG
jgi:8-amino-7-oxononanoate synthase